MNLLDIIRKRNIRPKQEQPIQVSEPRGVRGVIRGVEKNIPTTIDEGPMDRIIGSGSLLRTFMKGRSTAPTAPSTPYDNLRSQVSNNLAELGVTPNMSTTQFQRMGLNTNGITLDDNTVIRGRDYQDLLNNIVNYNITRSQQQQQTETQTRGRLISTIVKGSTPQAENIRETYTQYGTKGLTSREFRSVQDYINKGYVVTRTAEGYSITYPTPEQFNKLAGNKQETLIQDLMKSKEFDDFLKSKEGQDALKQYYQLLEKELMDKNPFYVRVGLGERQPTSEEFKNIKIQIAREMLSQAEYGAYQKFREGAIKTLEERGVAGGVALALTPYNLFGIPQAVEYVKGGPEAAREYQVQAMYQFKKEQEKYGAPMHFLRFYPTSVPGILGTTVAMKYGIPYAYGKLSGRFPTAGKMFYSGVKYAGLGGAYSSFEGGIEAIKKGEWGSLGTIVATAGLSYGIYRGLRGARGLSKQALYKEGPYNPLKDIRYSDKGVNRLSSRTIKARQMMKFKESPYNPLPKLKAAFTKRVSARISSRTAKAIQMMSAKSFYAPDVTFKEPEVKSEIDLEFEAYQRKRFNIEGTKTIRTTALKRITIPKTFRYPVLLPITRTKTAFQERKLELTLPQQALKMKQERLLKLDYKQQLKTEKQYQQQVQSRMRITMQKQAQLQKQIELKQDLKQKQIQLQIQKQMRMQDLKQKRKLKQEYVVSLPLKTPYKPSKTFKFKKYESPFKKKYKWREFKIPTLEFRRR